MKENKIEAIIDVGGKPSIRRIAVATGIILLQEKTILAIKQASEFPKSIFSYKTAV